MIWRAITWWIKAKSIPIYDCTNSNLIRNEILLIHFLSTPQHWLCQKSTENITYRECAKRIPGAGALFFKKFCRFHFIIKLLWKRRNYGISHQNKWIWTIWTDLNTNKIFWNTEFWNFCAMVFLQVWTSSFDLYVWTKRNFKITLTLSIYG